MKVLPKIFMHPFEPLQHFLGWRSIVFNAGQPEKAATPRREGRARRRVSAGRKRKTAALGATTKG
jgi:hypothetical protein